MMIIINNITILIHHDLKLFGLIFGHLFDAMSTSISALNIFNPSKQFLKLILPFHVRIEPIFDHLTRSAW